MKSIINPILFTSCMLSFGIALSQEEPSEILKETEVRQVQFTKQGELHEGTLKLITTQTANVELNEAEKYNLNQSRIPATKKIQKTVLLDNDKDAAYDIRTRDVFYVKDDKDYKFSPNDNGFDITYSNKKDTFINLGEAWQTNSPGIYIIRDKTYNGIGYFSDNDDFVVDYYDKKSNTIKSIVYKQKANNLQNNTTL